MKTERFLRPVPVAGNIQTVLFTRVYCDDCGKTMEYEGHEAAADINLATRQWTKNRQGYVRCTSCTVRFGQAVERALRSVAGHA